jgi:transposase
MGMVLTWYGRQSSDESCDLGPLALVWPLLERMNVSSIIDQHLPADPQAEFAHGRVLSLLVAARMSNPVALSNVAAWAGRTGADILWDMPVEKMNDDRLGRSLDAFFQQRHSILASVALHVARAFDVSLEELHYDPTHIVFHGAYDGSEPRPDGPPDRSDAAQPPAHITVGRKMSDAAGDVKLIHAGLCVAVDRFGGVPVFGHAVSGNQNGHTAVAEQFALLKKHLRPRRLMMISDRGTFSAGYLARLDAEGFHALCSVPWKDFRGLFHAHREQLAWKRASFLSIEQKRRRETRSTLPQEHYELTVLRHELVDPESGRKIPCRVIFVFSTADQKVARQTREKTVASIRQGLEKLAASVAAGRRNTDRASVERRVVRLFGGRSAAAYFTYRLVPLNQAERAALPPPQRGCRQPEDRFEFEYDAARAAADEADDGISALVTTAPRESSADQLFTCFKQQNESELANHQFKTPLAVHPVFLKSPQRVEALVFLMMIALTTWYILQRMYRQAVPPNSPVREQRATTETLLRTFSTYTLLIQQTRSGRIVHPTRLTTRQREILNQLGFQTPAQILCGHLPRAPD